MTLGMGVGRLVDTGGANGCFDGPLQRLFVDVMAPFPPRSWIHRSLPGWEDILIFPFEASARIFSRQSIGEIDLTKTILEILFMNQPDFIQMLAQGIDY